MEINMEFEPDEIESYGAACEEAQAAVISAIANGELSFIDGVMSPISLALSARLGTTKFDMNSWWVETPQNWKCPACGRNKLALARLNTKGEIMCHLVEHHDHMKNVLERRFQEISVSRQVIVADEHAQKFAKRSATMVSAYENTLICVDCNNADAIAKKATMAHLDFSFSPQELFRIVKAEPNKPHEINNDAAKKIWADQQNIFQLRMKIANRIAEIAANNDHWFQPGDFNCNPEVISQRAKNLVVRKGAYGVLDLLKGPKKAKPVKQAFAWRHVSYRPSKPSPTSNEIEHAGQVGNPRFWNILDEEWRCPACRRKKREIIRKNKNGEWAFLVGSRIFFDANHSRNRKEIICCGDCMLAAQNLGNEAALLAGWKVEGGYATQVDIQEIGYP
jgi:rubredoxin